MSITLDNLAQRIGATLIGDGSITVDSCAPVQTAGPHQITFLANPAYVKYLATTNAAAVVIDSKTSCPDHVNRLVADDPYFTFRNAMIALHGFREHTRPFDIIDSGDRAGDSPADVMPPAISAAATVHPDATIGPGTQVHPNVTIESGARIGRGCVLYPGVYIGAGAKVGDECVLFPNVVIYHDCVLGDRVTLHANTVIGQDGFGYATHDGEHHKIPQAGIAVIEDDVEMGAGCAIERAAMGETRIGQGTKFADLISIGHGTRIGRHCLLVSLAGISGSVEMGNYVVLGGQVGIGGHLSIGDGVQVAAKSGVRQDVPAGMKVGGLPAVELSLARRNAMAALDLGGMAKRLKRLERELAKTKTS